jgi:GntR family transcriptional repressor for pyruvate dehydrogenase complex
MEPLQVLSLKAACIQRLEGLILSGQWQIGARLPSERDLAADLNISRPVLHESLVDLAAKGLVSIQPRRGVFVNDYRTSGSCALLSSLLAYSGGQLDPAFIQSLMDMRVLVEIETASLAAHNRKDEHLAQFEHILAQESTPQQNDRTLTDLDFSFHLLVAVASGNLVYPLILNSFKNVYTHLTGLFFDRYRHTPVVEDVFSLHRKLVDTIIRQEEARAAAIMREMLRHGEEQLKQIL